MRFFCPRPSPSRRKPTKSSPTSSPIWPKSMNEGSSGGLRMLAPHLTKENCEALLQKASGLSKKEIEVLVTDLAPKPSVPDSIRKLPERSLLLEVESSAPGRMG